MIKIFLSIFIINSFFYYFHKKLYTLELLSKKEGIQNFNRSEILGLGGLIFFLCLLINFEYFNFSTLIFYFIIFLLGLSADTDKIISPFLRLVLIFFIVSIYISFSDLMLETKNFPLISSLLKNKIFNLVFLTFCISIVINGINFVDGINNNVNIYFFIFNVFIILQKINAKIDYDINLIFMFFSICFFILNHKNRYMLGDNGSYLVGAIMSLETIFLINQMDYLSRYYAIILLIYPSYETLFSIIRKINKNPLYPDNGHFHLLSYKFFRKNHLKTSFGINTYNFLFLFLGYIFSQNNTVTIFLIFTYIIFYNFLYHFILKRN